MAWGAILNSEITSPKHKNAKSKNMAVNRPQKVHLFYSVRAETGKQSIALFDPSLECCIGQLRFLPLCVYL